MELSITKGKYSSIRRNQPITITRRRSRHIDNGIIQINFGKVIQFQCISKSFHLSIRLSDPVSKARSVRSYRNYPVTQRNLAQITLMFRLSQRNDSARSSYLPVAAIWLTHRLLSIQYSKASAIDCTYGLIGRSKELSSYLARIKVGESVLD